MRRPAPSRAVSRALLLAALAALAAAPLGAQHPTRIEGLRLVPTRPGGQLLEVAGCKAHTVPADGGGFEEVRGCEERLPASQGDRLLWLEGEGLISPARFVVGRGPLPTADRQLPMVPAGIVRWSAASRQAAGFTAGNLQLYFLHLESHLKAIDDEALEMSRWASPAEAEAGVAMPTGELVVLLFDEAGTPLAMSRPFELSARKPSELALSPPDPGLAQVFVELQRPVALPRAEFRQTGVFLQFGDTDRREAAALLVTGRQVIALFYEVPAQRGQLEAVAGNAKLEPQPIRLQAGRVLYHQARLEAMPSLHVVLDLPPGLRGLPLAVEVLEDGGAPLRRVELTQSARETRIDLLPPSSVEVLLMASPYVFRQPANLRRGDAEVIFAPQPIEVHGTVYRGNEEAMASLVFSELDSTGQGFTVESDENGRYAATFWKPGRYQVALHFRTDLPPYTEEVEIPDRADHTLDLRAPGNNLRLRVVDGASGEPITRPTIYLRHRPPSGQPVEHEFSAEGEVVDLPPIEAGVLELSAAAQGYLRSQVLAIQVDSVREGSEPLEIALSRTTAARRVSLRDPAGRELAGVAARAQFDLADGTPVWEGISDRQGQLEIPQEAMGAFLVLSADRHAPSIQVLDKDALSQGEDPIVFLMMPGGALQLRTLGLGSQGRAAAVAIWIDGNRVSGATLTFVCGSASSDESGLFACTRPMPLGALLALAWDEGREPPPAIQAITLPAVRQGAVDVPVLE